MKPTDSVKDKFIKWLAEESGEPEHLVMLMQSVYVNPESMFKFFSHSLAEARREWVGEMRKDLQISDEILGDGGTVGILTSQRLRTYIDTQKKLNSYFDLLTVDNPEEVK